MLRNLIFVHDFEYVEKITKMLQDKNFSGVYLIPIEDVRRLLLLNIANPVFHYEFVNDNMNRFDKFGKKGIDYTMLDYTIMRNMKNLLISFLERVTTKGIKHYLDTLYDNILNGKYKKVKTEFITTEDEDRIITKLNEYGIPRLIDKYMNEAADITDYRSLMVLIWSIIDIIKNYIYDIKNNEIVGLTNNILSVNIKNNVETAFVIVNYPYLYRLAGMITELIHNRFNIKEEVSRYTPVYVTYLLLDLVLRKNKNVREFIESKSNFNDVVNTSGYMMSDYFLNCPIITTEFSKIIR